MLSKNNAIDVYCQLKIRILIIHLKILFICWYITVKPRSTSLNRYHAELVLRFTQITKQFFALKLI